MVNMETNPITVNLVFSQKFNKHSEQQGATTAEEMTGLP